MSVYLLPLSLWPRPRSQVTLFCVHLAEKESASSRRYYRQFLRRRRSRISSQARQGRVFEQATTWCTVARRLAVGRQPLARRPDRSALLGFPALIRMDRSRSEDPQSVRDGRWSGAARKGGWTRGMRGEQEKTTCHMGDDRPEHPFTSVAYLPGPLLPDKVSRPSGVETINASNTESRLP